MRPKAFVTRATRCGECHEKMIEEWKPSAHAMAATSPIYLAARKHAGNENCGDRCHSPLTPILGAADPVAAEGITCDVCHTMRDPKPSAKGSDFRLAIDDMVKYGPRCDLEDHYFHRMGCSKEHTTAELCGTCHWWERKGIPVFTEYKDFREGDDAAKGVVCQDCHMPAEKAPLANGSPPRAGVPHHGLLGVAGDLRKRSIVVEATARAEGDSVAVDVSVTNAAAAHYIPTGLPERRLVIEVLHGGAIVDKAAMIGRILGDDSGAEVPFWRATKVLADTRIAPGATSKQRFTLSPPGPGSIEIRVSWSPLSPVVARAIGVDALEQQYQRIATLAIPFGGKTAAGRALLPKTVSYIPASPGKRRRSP